MAAVTGIRRDAGGVPAMFIKCLDAFAVTLGLIGMGTQARADQGSWQADTGRSQVAVHVAKRGLLSGMAHDHQFVPGRWSATASFDPARPSDVQVEVVIIAASLRDNQPKLSPEDRAKVDALTAGPEVLDATRYQEIRFTATSFEPSVQAGLAGGRLQGLLVGTLSLHGQKRPLSVRVVATADGRGWRVRGAVAFKQTDFGIEPYSGFLGTIAVHDEVKVVCDLAMMPAR